MTLAELRKTIKAMGYGLKTKTYSFGRAAIYTHLESGEELTGNVAPASYWEKWKPLTTWCKTNTEALKALGKEEGIIGLIP